MTVRTATCRCGQLSAECTGDPVRVSVCHCLDCKRRSGSAFAAQARWPTDQVVFAGDAREWTVTGDSGQPATFHFCPVCGGTVWYRHSGLPDLVAVPIGAFAEPGFRAPEYSVYEGRKHAWVEIMGEVEHID